LRLYLPTEDWWHALLLLLLLDMHQPFELLLGCAGAVVV
jgi:hypothetical protein